MERYLRALKKNRAKILSLPNVVGIGVGYKEAGGVDTKEPALIVYVEKKLPSSVLARSHVVPPAVDGMPTDVVEIGKVKLLGLRTEKVRPCQPGVSIGHYQSTAGTLGAVVRDRATSEIMILSNNHVLANGSTLQQARAKPGDPILQPGPYDGGTLLDRIGTLCRYVPLIKSAAKSDCPVASAVAAAGTRFLNLFRQDYELRFYRRYRGENVVDCAAVRLDSPDLVKPCILEIGEVTGLTEAHPGMEVQKSGRTTGLTRGVVKSIGTTLQVEMREDEKIWFTDQVVADMPSRPGDSGSLVLDQNRRAVGLLFAGSEKLTVFNRIGSVLERLGVELVTG